VSTLLLKSARVFDPAQASTRPTILVTATMAILAVGKRLAGDQSLDCRGLLVCPGFLNIFHRALPRAGLFGKETIAAGSAAAVHGGFTAVVVMPNTDPPLDNSAAIAYQDLQGKTRGRRACMPWAA
jgi:dihydroorotase